MGCTYYKHTPERDVYPLLVKFQCNEPSLQHDRIHEEEKLCIACFADLVEYEVEQGYHEAGTEFVIAVEGGFTAE